MYVHVFILLVFYVAVSCTVFGNEISRKPLNLEPDFSDSHSKSTHQQSTLQQSSVMLDTRTPPRYKYQLEFVQNQTEAPYHKGEAIPVTDTELYKETKSSTTHPKDGISTWVLLSNNRSTKNKTKSSTTIATTLLSSSTSASSDDQLSNEATPDSTMETNLFSSSDKSQSPLEKKVAIPDTTEVNANVTEAMNKTSVVTATAKISTTKKTKKNSNRRKNSSKKKSALKNKTNGTETAAKNSTLLKASKTAESSIASTVSEGVSEIVSATNLEKPITTRIMNFFSREIVPSVGFGMMTVAVLTGIIAYFSTNPGIYRSYPEPIRRHDYNSLLYGSSAGNSEELAVSNLLSQLSSNKYYDNPYAELEEDRKLNPEIKAKGYVYSDNLQQPRSFAWRKKRESKIDIVNIENEQWANINKSIASIRKSIRVLLGVYFKTPLELGVNFTRKFRNFLTSAEQRLFPTYDLRRKFSRINEMDNEVETYSTSSSHSYDLTQQKKPSNFNEIFGDYLRKKFYIALLMTKSATEALNDFLEEVKNKIEHDLNYV